MHGEMGDEKMMWKMHCREYMALRILTAVIVTIFVFWAGFEFGEIRASVGPMHYGSFMMDGFRGGAVDTIAPPGSVYNGQ